MSSISRVPVSRLASSWHINKVSIYVSRSGWHFLFKEQTKQPQIWIKSAFQSYSWFLCHQWLRVYRHNPTWSDMGLRKLNTSHRYAKVTWLPLVWMIQKCFKTQVFWEVMLYSCRWRNQNLLPIKKTDFSFNTNSARARYVCKATDE